MDVNLNNFRRPHKTLSRTTEKRLPRLLIITQIGNVFFLSFPWGYCKQKSMYTHMYVGTECHDFDFYFNVFGGNVDD